MPAVDSGVKQAQVFVGRDSLVADVYPMKSGKQFLNALEGYIRYVLIQNTNCSLLLPDDGLNTQRRKKDNTIQQSNNCWKILTGRSFQGF